MARNIEKVRAARRRWYAKNKQHAKKKIQDRRDELSKWFADYKATQKCADCPEAHQSCLEFHHISNNKESTLSKAVNDGWSRTRIMAEVSKCVCLCANCHRKRHWDESKQRLDFM